MDGLTIGLAFGMAAGGAVAGAAVTMMGDLALGIGAAIWGGRHKETSPFKGAFVGAAAGGLLGLVIGIGTNYLSNDEVEPTPLSFEQECKLNAPDDKVAVVTQDALGNPVCSHK